MQDLVNPDESLVSMADSRTIINPRQNSPALNMNSLSAIQRDLLLIVDGLGACTAAQARTELEAYYPEEISSTRVERNLSALVDRGLLQRSTTDASTMFESTPAATKTIRTRRTWEVTFLDS